MAAEQRPLATRQRPLAARDAASPAIRALIDLTSNPAHTTLDAAAYRWLERLIESIDSTEHDGGGS